MRALADQIRRFARADANVLIAGETGTGKDAVARELHARGPRAKRPFVTIDCPSLSPSLIDSEIFGHERGAFTDALTARAGRFELAGNGTVYLDAVLELSVDAQGKLLRIVEEKRVERLGGAASIPVGARVVASAGAHIEDAVRAGEFRRDLYHRLRVLPLFIPPLRERLEDIPALVGYFSRRAAAARGRSAPKVSRDAAEALKNYAWPGNVRQLRHAIERACQVARGGTITLDHLSQEILDASAALEPETTRAERPTLDEVERRYIAATLFHAQRNEVEAARILGITRKALREKRKRFGLE